MWVCLCIPTHPLFMLYSNAIYVYQYLSLFSLLFYNPYTSLLIQRIFPRMGMWMLICQGYSYQHPLNATHNPITSFTYIQHKRSNYGSLTTDHLCFKGYAYCSHRNTVIHCTVLTRGHSQLSRERGSHFLSMTNTECIWLLRVRMAWPWQCLLVLGTQAQDGYGQGGCLVPWEAHQVR